MIIYSYGLQVHLRIGGQVNKMVAQFCFTTVCNIHATYQLSYQQVEINQMFQQWHHQKQKLVSPQMHLLLAVCVESHVISYGSRTISGRCVRAAQKKPNIRQQCNLQVMKSNCENEQQHRKRKQTINRNVKPIPQSGTVLQSILIGLINTREGNMLNVYCVTRTSVATIDHCKLRPLYNGVVLIGKMEDRKLQNKPDNDVNAGDGDSSVS